MLFKNRMYLFIAIFTLLAYTVRADAQSTSSGSTKTPIFEDSCVTSISPWSAQEDSDYLPKSIFPAYIGSGKIGISIDASGMQNLDCTIGAGDRYTKVKYEHKDDMYVFAEGMISSHVNTSNLMPLGYLRYDISIDGKPVSLDNSVIKWRRVLDIHRAIVKTALYFKEGILLEISAFTPQETNQAHFRFEVQSMDGSNHSVIIKPQLSLRLRKRNGGRFILDRVDSRSATAHSAAIIGEVNTTGRFAPLEDYKLIYTVNAGNVWLSYDALGCEMKFEAGGKASHDDVEFELGRWAPHTDFDSALRTHEKDWSAYYSGGASISIGDSKREFIFNNSLYLLRIGATYNKGLPLEFLLFHPENWYGCTFWDLDFIVDALIKSDHLEQPKRVMKWLSLIAGPDGSRPFHWMTFYNGSSGMPEGGKDTGLYVSASHAMSAIRYFEATHDAAFLKSTLYPIIRKAAIYAVSQIFVREGDHYIGSGSGIDANSQMLLNDSFSTIWFGVILRKSADYAKQLGVDDSYRQQWTEIADNIRLDTCDRGYKYCRDWGGPDGFVWMMLYPTECMPLIDMSVFNKCRKDMYFGDLGQPWCYFWQASSDFRTGLNTADTSEKYISEGLRFVYGPGYFAEGIPGGRPMEGLPPYASAHGAYITAALEQLVLSSIWNDDIDVFTNLPTNMRGRQIEFNRIRTSRGVLVSGRYSPQGVHITLMGKNAANLRIRIPDGIAAPKMTVVVNGKPQYAVCRSSSITITAQLNEHIPTKIDIGK